ncbi:hypothetical protein BBJ28_00016283 [Nothophytophthora sp. Chile5]|nr:hypothetical protein BBJ28_00016283 [Nothophytophthora sp. Chile5]
MAPVPPPVPPPLPPPLPPGTGPASVHQPLPPHLQAMMRQMQQQQPKFMQQAPVPRLSGPPPPPQQQHGGRGFRGGRGGRGRGGGFGRGGRGRGRGRGARSGGFQQQQHNYSQPQFKRKRVPSDDAPDASRFFSPSCLEDPWRHLEAAPKAPIAATSSVNVVASPHARQPRQQQSQELRPRQLQTKYAPVNRPGRVLFQPSFLEDPWSVLAR